MGALIGIIKRRGFRKGVSGGNSRWVVVWLLISATQVLRKRAARKEVVERFTLKPGESILITDLALPESEAGPVAP